MISVDNIEKEYGEGEEMVQALEDINFGVEEGEFISIVGPSGCGKTTLLHLIAGILEPTTGSVTIRGTDVQSPEHEKHSVGLVFQDAVLLEWSTVHDNVMLPAKILTENNNVDQSLDYYQQRTDELLELVGLGGFEDSYPNQLSGGMQQRVSICRSLVYGPDVLLMDEPFGALDAFTRNKMNEELLRIWRETGKTILFVTHNLEEATFLSDRVVILAPRPGRIIDIIEIDLDRPRNDQTRTDSAYHDQVSDVYKHFEE